MAERRKFEKSEVVELLYVLSLSLSLSLSLYIYIYKGKAIPLQAWTGPEGSRRLRILRQSTHEGGKVVSPTHRPPLPQETFLVLISVTG
jgi:hypothetical protein